VASPVPANLLYHRIVMPQTMLPAATGFFQACQFIPNHQLEVKKEE